VNIEQTKEAIKVMQAFVDGKELEVREVDEWRRTFIPLWQWHTNDYRIKPTPTLRPWNADEVPLDCWLRTHQGNNRYKWKPVTIQPLGVIIQPADIGYSLTLHTWEFLSKNCEHSTDGGKTWKECGVMEESK
jgi:hypothetical protein